MITPTIILDWMNSRFSLDISDKIQKRKYADLRKIYYRLCMSYTRGFNFTYISGLVNCHHSSMTTGLHKHDEFIEHNFEYRKLWEDCNRDFKECFLNKDEVKKYREIEKEEDWRLRKRVLDLEQILYNKNVTIFNLTRKLERIKNN